MSEKQTIWIVVAEECDYYPEIVTLGAFASKEAAEAYAASQPPSVRVTNTWTDRFGKEVISHRDNAFSYEVQEIPVNPSGPWRTPTPKKAAP